MRINLFLIALFFTLQVSAQKKGTTAYEPPVTPEYAAQLKTQILVFVLLEEDPKYVEELTKKQKTDELKKYQGDINYYNTKIQDLAPKLLTFSKSVAFKKLTEIVEMSQKEREECSFVVFDKHAEKIKSTRSFVLSGSKEHNYHDQFHSAKVPASFVKDYLYHILSLDGDEALLHLNFFTKVKKTNMKQYAKNFLTTNPTEEEFTYILSQIQKEFENPVQKTAPKAEVMIGDILKDKTLIINKEDLSDKSTEEAIKKNYPYPYELISKEDYQKELLNKDSKRCLLVVKPLLAAYVPNGNKMDFVIAYGQEIINEETRELLKSIAPPLSATGENSTGLAKNFKKIEPEDFKAYTKGK